jgi:hypothetical protein
VRAVFSYTARGPDEIALAEGELIELSSGPTGGRNYGDGWWEGLFFAWHLSIRSSQAIQGPIPLDKKASSQLTMSDHQFLSNSLHSLTTDFQVEDI